MREEAAGAGVATTAAATGCSAMLFIVGLAIAAFVEVSIRDQDVAPMLAGFALAQAAVAAERNSDSNSALTLAAEFRERFPGHPANLTLPDALEAARQSTTTENDA